MALVVGIKGRAETVVSEANTAKTVGSGTLPVFATPMMAALMEQAAWESIQPYLDEGMGSVGTKLCISHQAATAVGGKVWAESEVTLVDGRRIELAVRAYDEAGLIGQGSHERFIVADERFTAKAEKRLLEKG